MGSVQFGIPRELALALKDRYGLRFFTETGTLEGHTALWAKDHFESVVTVDIKQQAILPGVNAVECDSAKFLEMFPEIEGPTMFWLDAHTDESCPVLREIAAINTYPQKNLILVDDARLFDTLPAWPKKHEVIRALTNEGRRKVYEVDDVLVAEPCH